ncbi:hypothetical protein STRIP9103_05302 [Streptomyces ipomoeae 91-03]|uniref:Uncharacterized protein n=1 Tax=Streptomyces ipomoeae 91-03 TaxID=698759 RepID=L1L1P5_9ACTN|nr:hypothetical protein STRIP9103_05302 [Streptomyces ipomoeae 91-03]
MGISQMHVSRLLARTLAPAAGLRGYFGMPAGIGTGPPLLPAGRTGRPVGWN